MTGGLDVAALLATRVRAVADWPAPGIDFKDITPLLADPVAFTAAVEAMVRVVAGQGIDKVVGVEARGFILAAPVAYQLGVGFVPVRKAGKLPAPTYAEACELEYGQATLEVHRDAFSAGDRVLVVDDVLATGGTIAATSSLVRAAGGHVVGCSVLIELAFLHGRDRLDELPVHSLLVY